MELLHNIKKNIRLEQSISYIQKALIYLYLDDSISTKDLALKLELPIPIVTALKKELVKEGLMDRRSFYHLNSKGREYIRVNLGLSEVNVELYIKLMNNYQFKENYKLEIIEFIDKYYNNRNIKKELDQAFATIDTSINRLFLVINNPLFFFNNIIFMGDDDLSSLVLAYTFQKLNLDTSNIIVLDVDSDILNIIDTFNKDNKTNINILKSDFRTIDKLPNYDGGILFVDPPYTIEGLNTFISKGLTMLKEDAHIYLSFGNKSPLIQYQIQKELSNMRLNIKDIRLNFNTYHHASILSNKSNMYILERINKDADTINSKQKIYTNDKKQSQRVGYHTLFELRDCDSSNLIESKAVEKSMNDIVEMFNLNKVTSNFHQFNPHGVSGVIVLQESHFTIHTWPEYNYAALDLFVCDKTIDEKAILSVAKKIFKSKDASYKKIYRES